MSNKYGVPISELNEVRLHIGSGDIRRAGFLNLDCRPEVKPDILCHLGEEPVPLQDNTVIEIYSYHAFEHFNREKFIKIVCELARISANKAKWQIIVPYATNTKYNLVNPYHLNPLFSEDTFRFFTGEIYPREKPKEFTLEQTLVLFNYNTDLWGTEPEEPWHILKEKYLNVVRDIDIHLVVHK